MSTVHHQQHLNTVYTQYMLVQLASDSVVRMLHRFILTTLADANRTSKTNTHCCVYSVEILLMMNSGPVRNMQSTLSNKFEKQCVLLAFVIRIRM